MGWYTDLGIRADHLRLRAHGPDELSITQRSDIEYLFPMGWSELEGIANRGDYDLTRHAEFSGRSRVRRHRQRRALRTACDRAVGRRRSRDVLAFFVDAYDEEEVEGRERVVAPPSTAGPGEGGRAPAREQGGQPSAPGPCTRSCGGACRRSSTRRTDRSATAARTRSALWGHDRPSDDGRRHRGAARPRLARAGPDRDLRARRRARAQARGRGGRRSRDR